MSELKMGDRVRILNGGECKVLAKLGEGGQGIICKEILNKELQQLLFFGHKN